MSTGGVALFAHEFGLPLLDELPGESLFSHCARQHRMWGFTHASRTCNALFGSPRGGVHHDFPNSLARLEQRTTGAFGEASVLARRRTVLSFYVPFLALDELEAAVHVMSGPSVAHLKFRLGFQRLIAMSTNGDPRRHGLHRDFAGIRAKYVVG